MDITREQIVESYRAMAKRYDVAARLYYLVGYPQWVYRRKAPRWLGRLALATVRPFGVTDAWIARRPWEAIRGALDASLVDVSWTELYLGVAYLAVGSRDSAGA